MHTTRHRKKEVAMPTEAHGTFEVKLTPQTDSQATIGRMLIEKQFSGALEATSKGEMLAISTKVSGSAGYVAIEQVSGILHGFRGSFALQHSGTMTRGTGQLVVTVV